MDEPASPNLALLLSTYLPVMLGLSVVSAFFSASEAALFSLTWAQRKQLQPLRKADGRMLSLLEKPDRLLSAILFWNLLVNMAFFTMSSIVAAEWSLREGEQWWAAGFAAAAMMWLILFGELLPKSIGVLVPISLGRWVSLPLSLMVRALDPVTPVFRWISEMSRRLIWPGLAAETYLETSDLERAIELSTEDAELIEQEKSVLRNIIQLSEVRAEEWMRPRSEFIVQTQPLSLDQLRQSKIPQDHILVADRIGKEIVAFVSWADLALRQAKDIDRYKQSVLIVPWCTPLANVLNQMLRSGRKVAVVVNEHGESIGVLTSEDLEEATFDLEQSRSSRGLTRPGVVPMGDLQWEVTGSTSLRRIERAIGYRLPEGRFVTIAGVIQEFLQRLAKPGDQCVWGDFQLAVIESPRRGEMLVRMTKLAKEGSEP